MRAARAGFSPHSSRATSPASPLATSRVRIWFSFAPDVASRGGKERGSTDAYRAGIVKRENMSGKPAGGKKQIVVMQAREIRAQNGGFFKPLGGRADLVGGCGKGVKAAAHGVATTP